MYYVACDLARYHAWVSNYPSWVDTGSVRYSNWPLLSNTIEFSHGPFAGSNVDYNNTY